MDDRGKQHLSKRAIRSAFSISFSRTAQQVVQIGGTLILVRILTPDDFGVFGMAASIIGIFHIFNDLGFTDVTIQRTDISQGQLSNLFWINLFSNLVLSAFLILISPQIALFFGDERVRPVSSVMVAALIFLSLGNQHYAIEKRNLKFGKISVILFFSVLIANIIALTMAWMGARYWALVIRFIALPFIRSLIAWFAFSWKPGLPDFHMETKNLVIAGLRTSLSLVLIQIGQQIDKIIIGKVYNTEQLAYYRRAFSLFMLPVGQLTISLHHVATSTLSKLKDEKDEYIRYYLRAISLLSFISMPLAAILVVTSSDIIVLLLGSQWLASIPLFSMLGLSAGFQILYTTNSWIHVSLGTNIRRLKWDIFSLAFITISLITGLRYGTKGVALAYSCAIIALTVPAIAYALKPMDIKIRRILRTFWKYALASAISGFSAEMIISRMADSWFLPLRLVASVLIITLIYVGCVILFYRSLLPIKDFLIQIRKLKKHKGMS